MKTLTDIQIRKFWKKYFHANELERRHILEKLPLVTNITDGTLKIFKTPSLRRHYVTTLVQGYIDDLIDAMSDPQFHDPELKLTHYVQVREMNKKILHLLRVCRDRNKRAGFKDEGVDCPFISKTVGLSLKGVYHRMTVLSHKGVVNRVNLPHNKVCYRLPEGGK